MKKIKLFKFYRSSLLIIFAVFILPLNTMSANEEILIDTDEKAKEILLGHDWECKWKDGGRSGTSKRIYEKASLKKVTARVKNSYCPTDWGTLEGKIEEGRVTGKFSNNPSPCVSRTFDSKIYKSVDGSYYTKESYTIVGYGITGQFNCIAVAK